MGSKEDEVEITPTQYETIRFLANNPSRSYPEEIGENFNISRSAASKRLKTLRSKGLVEKEGQQTNFQLYSLTKRGFQVFDRYSRTQSESRKVKFRLHKIMFKFPISSKLEEVVEEVPTRDTLEMKNTKWINGGLRDPHDEVSYLITEKSLVVRLPEKVFIPSDTGVVKAYFEAFRESKEVKNIIEEKYSSLKIGEGEPALIESHGALVNDPRALLYDELENNLKVIEEEDLEFDLDHSKGNVELEVKGQNTEEQSLNLALNLDSMMRKDIGNEVTETEHRLRHVEKALLSMDKPQS